MLEPIVSVSAKAAVETIRARESRMVKIFFIVELPFSVGFSDGVLRRNYVHKNTTMWSDCQCIFM